MTFARVERPISALRARMIQDMTVRNFVHDTQREYIRAVKKLAAFLGRSPEGPRRMGTDKNADVLWVGNSWGSSLARIDTRTLQTTIVPFPDPAYQPYHIAVDKNHNVWANMWTTDRIARYNPATAEWTFFDTPVRGTEIRHVSLLELPGQDTKVTVPLYRNSKMGAMTLRTEAEIGALKAQASK